MRVRIPRVGFSLVEVVLALGIAGTAVVLVLAVLPKMSQSGSEAADTYVASGIADAIRIEMERQSAVAGFTSFAGSVHSNGLSLVADRRGTRLHALDQNLLETPERLPEGEQFFSVKLTGFDSEPLVYNQTKSFLAVQAEVTWPYRVPSSNSQGYLETSLETRRSLRFVVTISR